MKRKKAQAEKTSVGTVVGARMRAECNKLTDAQREKLGEEFLKLYYGGEVKPATTHRRSSTSPTAWMMSWTRCP